VMVVDDSAVVRGLITRILQVDPRIEVAASCSNGQMAVVQAARKEMDVIILDIEMPVMDGLTALPKLQEVNPHARIIMASTLTQRNAAISLKALTLGATDYIAKPTTDKLNASEEFRRDLIHKVIALGQRKKPAPGLAQRPPTTPQLVPRPKTDRRPRIIAIGSSTGGPQALLTLLGALPATVECPIVIAQHMPATFTTVLAQHIARTANRPCAEASAGRLSFPDRASGRRLCRAAVPDAAGEFLPPVGEPLVPQRVAIVRRRKLRRHPHRHGQRWLRRRARNGSRRRADHRPG
jgi:two-component system, chemotaxis family, protein-glutamate methylesterase/glutaminase